MRKHRGIIRRSAALGLAVWFAAAAVFVQGLHRHPAGGPDPTPDAGHPRCLAAGYAPAEAESGAPLIALGASTRQSHDVFGYCLACLFLKNCKERAIEWKSMVPVLPTDDYALLSGTFIVSSPVVVSSSPRAPPVSTA